MTKRKSTPKKATKTKESYFDAERILDERKVSGKWQYLIKWSGHDRNGKPWSPDWQPKDNCTQMLLKEWEQEKLRQRKRQEEQKNKENRENDNQEDPIQERNIKQEDHSMDLQDDKADNKLQMDIDKPDHKITDDKMQQVLDKYCQNINDDIKRKTQSLGPITVKRDMNPSRKFIKSLKYPVSKVKLIKISPIQPTFANNLPIKSCISILEPANNICGKKISIPSKSERVSLINLNKRGLEDHNNNNSITTKRQRTEDVYDVNRKNNQSNANGKVEDSRISASSSNVKNKKSHSKTNESSNKISSDGNLTNSQSMSIYNVPSTQHIGAIHVNSETIKALNSRSSLAPKYRPIAAKVIQSQYNNATSSSNSSNAVNVYSSSSTGKWSGNNSNASSSRQNSSTNKLASIRNPVSADNLPKSGILSSSSQTDKDVPISTSAQHTSYFHKSYVQSTSVPTSVPKTVSNSVTKSNQSVDNHINQTMMSSQKASTSNKQSIISSTNEQSNQQQSSNLQNSSIGTSSMENNNNNNNDSHNQPLSQISLEKLKEPTVENIDFLISELTKAKSLNETLEKEKLDLLKEKNRYCKEANQLKLEVERRPQSGSETTETIKKCQENITKMYNKWMDSQNKFETKCNDYTKLELEHSKLHSDYNQVKKIVMTKHSEVETLKGELNGKIQELKDLGEENNRLKADWVKNGVIFMREDYQKITKLQNSLQDLINQRNSFNAEINRWRETINKEINDMKNENYEDDDEEYDNLYLQIENLKLQNKLQETSLRMAEENSKMAEESTKLMFDLKKLTIEEFLKKYDVPSFPNSQASSSSSNFANLLTKNSNNSISSNNNIVNQSRQSQNNHQGGNTRKMSGSAEMRSAQNDSVQGHVNTNTNILQARNLATAPSIVAMRNFSSNSARNLNTPRISTAVVRENTNSRTLSSTTSPTGIIPNRGAALPLGVRRSSIVTTIPIEMNVRPSISTTEKSKVIRFPNPKSPTKSIQQMNYFCEWDYCRRSFDDKIELKKHIKEDHFSFG